MLSDDEIRAALFASGLHKSGRTMFTRWKDGIDIQLPVPEVTDFARAVERAAYERAAQACEACENRVVKTHPARIEFDPDSMMARKCAAAIRALGGQHD